MRTDSLITLTTDFGLDDPFVGVMKGIIFSIAPHAHIIDLTHGITPHDVREAAFTVGMNYRFFPERTVHVVVVDPGVGSERLPLVVLAGGHYFVGPDNGVFSFIYEKEKESLQVVHVTATRYFRREKSPTFQGRDVFAPVAGQIARGMNLAEFGRTINDYVSIELLKPRVKDNTLTGEVIHIDRFGNCLTNISRADIDALARHHRDGFLRLFFREKEIPLKKFYADAKDRTLCAVVNSSEYLEIFVSRANAATAFNISIGDHLEMK